MPHLPCSRKIPSSADHRLRGRWFGIPAAAAVIALTLSAPAAAQVPQSPRGPSDAPPSQPRGDVAAPAAGGAPAASAGDLEQHIRNLASIDYPTRMNAARLIRRADAATAVAALREAVAKHPDEFVRYRAFILLSSFDDRQTGAMVSTLLADRNDRLREAAYKWLEQHPDPSMTATLLKALQTELAEFVRPALIGAVAALGSNPQVQKALVPEVTRGVDFFRAAAIDSLGRHRAAYAADAIAGVAALEGPLQDDAVLALARLGGARARTALAALKNPPRTLVPTIRAAQCLIGEPCDAILKELVEAASAQGATTSLVRATVTGLSAVAASGNGAAFNALLTLAERGGAVRDESALGLAAAAVRNPERTLAWLDGLRDPVRGAALDLLKLGFEDLEEDFGEEQFFAATRAFYWKSPESSSGRTLASDLISKLEF